MSTTEGYIRYAEQYYHDLPVDWIDCALKSTEDTMTGLHKENGYKGEIQQAASSLLTRFPSVVKSGLGEI